MNAPVALPLMIEFSRGPLRKMLQSEPQVALKVMESLASRIRKDRRSVTEYRVPRYGGCMARTAWTKANLRHALTFFRQGRNPAAAVYESIGPDFFLALAPGWLGTGYNNVNVEATRPARVREGLGPPVRGPLAGRDRDRRGGKPQERLGCISDGQRLDRVIARYPQVPRPLPTNRPPSHAISVDEGSDTVRVKLPEPPSN